MASLNYNKYYFIGNALTEEKFLELKYLFQMNRYLVAEKYRVHYLREIFTEFKSTLILILITILASIIIYPFVPKATEGENWLSFVLFITIGATFFNTISLIISLVNFFSYLDDKNRYGKLHLYLFETCPDFKSYMDVYLKYAV